MKKYQLGEEMLGVVGGGAEKEPRNMKELKRKIPVRLKLKEGKDEGTIEIAKIKYKIVRFINPADNKTNYVLADTRSPDDPSRKLPVYWGIPWKQTLGRNVETGEKPTEWEARVDAFFASDGEVSRKHLQYFITDDESIYLEHLSESNPTVWNADDFDEVRPTQLDGEYRTDYANSYGGSDTGATRDHNEDRYNSSEVKTPSGEKALLTVLCDGMGGHENGEEAARIIANKMITELQSAKAKPGSDAETSINAAITAANKALLDYNMQRFIMPAAQRWVQDGLHVQPSDLKYDEALQNAVADILKGESRISKSIEGKLAGTTLSLSIIFPDGSYIIANRGDSRTYLISNDPKRNGKITNDNSLVFRLLELGQISVEDLWDNPHKNVVFRALNGQPISDEELTDFYHGQLKPGEMLLHCSDGLWEMLHDWNGDKIAEIVAASSNPQEAVHTLITKANMEGGEDNITVIINKFKG